MDWISNVLSIVVICIAVCGLLFFVWGLLKAGMLLHDRRQREEERRLMAQYRTDLHLQLEEWHRRMADEPKDSIGE